MLLSLVNRVIGMNEKRLGETLDYTRFIAATRISLLMRFNKVFGFLDPNRNAPKHAYSVARLRGAMTADCGTCVRIEITLAKKTGLANAEILAVLKGQYTELSTELRAVAELADSVVGARMDNPEAREIVRSAFGDAALIEICFAMNGAALLPSVKRGLGYATSCEMGLFDDLLEVKA